MAHPAKFGELRLVGVEHVNAGLMLGKGHFNDAALGLAAQIGLEGLSIGALAEVAQMSKSGVFAHFGSREELQISVIREYHARFEEEVFFPAIREPRGLPRLRALFERWVRRVSVELEAGCIYISGAVEFDDRPGPVRDALVEMVRAWHAALARAIEPFYRANLEQPAGSGLGLSIVHRLGQRCRWPLQLDSTPGKGTRATIVFGPGIHQN